MKWNVISLETYIIEKLAQEEIENLNRPLSIKGLSFKLKKKDKILSVI